MSSTEQISTKILAYGSFVSIESIRAGELGKSLTHMIQNQSVISGMQRPYPIPELSETVEAAGLEAKKRADQDLMSSLMEVIRLNQRDIDLIVWDILPERYGVIDLGGNSYRSATPDHAVYQEEYQHAGQGKYISFGSDQHFALFKFCASKFLALLQQVGLKEKLVLLAPSFSDKGIDGKANDQLSIQAHDLNNTFARYMDFLVNGLAVHAIFHPDARVNINHPWGRAPFFYEQATYEYLGRGIRGYLSQLRARNMLHVAQGSSLVRQDWDSLHPVIAFSDVHDYVRKYDGVVNVRMPHAMVPMALTTHARKDSSYVPVFFSGALSPGQKVVGPVFSGRQIAAELDLPFVAIADPTLSIIPNPQLSWYIGSQEGIIQDDVAALLTKISDALGKPLLLIGGSGGGFAALDQIERNESGDFRAFVWNPQTDISRYIDVAIDQFLASSFPHVYALSGGISRAEKLSYIERNSGASFELLTAAFQGKMHNVVCLQDESDWHYSAHFLPLVQALGGAADAGGKIWTDFNHNCMVAHQWGKGHTPPPRAVMKEFVQLLATERSHGQEFVARILEITLD